MINPGHATWWHNPSPNLRGKCTADMELWGPWVFDKKRYVDPLRYLPKVLVLLIIRYHHYVSPVPFPRSFPRSPKQLCNPPVSCAVCTCGGIAALSWWHRVVMALLDDLSKQQSLKTGIPCMKTYYTKPVNFWLGKYVYIRGGLMSYQPRHWDFLETIVKSDLSSEFTTTKLLNAG
jgi:hypothetical protein